MRCHFANEIGSSLMRGSAQQRNGWNEYSAVHLGLSKSPSIYGTEQLAVKGKKIGVIDEKLVNGHLRIAFFRLGGAGT